MGHGLTVLAMHETGRVAGCRFASSSRKGSGCHLGQQGDDSRDLRQAADVVNIQSAQAVRLDQVQGLQAREVAPLDAVITRDTWGFSK